MNGQLTLWPATASAYAGQVDTLLISLTILVSLLAGPVFILIVVFAAKYRRGRPADRAHAVNRNVWLEISWTVVPLVLLLAFYAWSLVLFFQSHHPPADALEISVVAKQWMWKFQHPTGQREINDLHVPLGLPVKLTMTSEDVIHSLFLPALRIKQDVLPGRYTQLWFTADKAGAYRLTCTQFCGTDHSVMGGTIHVLSQGDYARWLRTSAVDQTLASQGEALFRKFGCSGCHGPSSTVHAPDLAGLAGRQVALSDGTTVKADAQYIRDSILLPNTQIAAGYPAIMPTFKNIVSEDDLIRLVAYIQSLAPGRGEATP